MLQGGLAGFFFGTASIFIRLLPGLSVFSVALGRLAIASLVLFTGVLILRHRIKLGPLKTELGRIFLLGVLLGSHFIFFVSSVRDTTILNATVLVNTTPVLTMLISTSLFKVKPSLTALSGIAVSTVGGVMIVYGDASLTFSSHLVGDVEAVLAALAEAFYLNLGKDVRNKLSPIVTMPLLYSAASLTIVLSAVLLRTPLYPPVTLDGILFLAGLGVIPTALAHTLYFSSLSGLKSFETAALALLEPIGATLLGVVVFAELPSAYFIAGASLVLSGILLILKQ